MARMHGVDTGFAWSWSAFSLSTSGRMRMNTWMFSDVPPFLATALVVETAAPSAGSLPGFDAIESSGDEIAPDSRLCNRLAVNVGGGGDGAILACTLLCDASSTRLTPSESSAFRMRRHKCCTFGSDHDCPHGHAGPSPVASVVATGALTRTPTQPTPSRCNRQQPQAPSSRISLLNQSLRPTDHHLRTKFSHRFTKHGYILINSVSNTNHSPAWSILSLTQDIFTLF